MYATCLFCHAGLGANEGVEHFPVGRRLAFDSVKGRLWVVCGRCQQWNLSPVEERWEALEECERLYRGTMVRVATANVGLCRLRDGTELVRIGAPVRPEFAAWRYGSVLNRRWKRATVAAGVGTAVAVVATPWLLPVVGAVAFMTLVSPALKAGMIAAYMTGKRYIESDRVVAVVPVENETLVVRVRHINAAHFEANESGDEMALELPHDRGTWRFLGADALTGASRLLARANVLGGSDDLVRKAADSIERAGSAQLFLSTAARRSHPDHRRYLAYQSGIGALRLAPVERLALEMAVHEAAERRALEGELAELENAWRSAEEIAAIADNLLLPTGVKEYLDEQP